MVFEFLQKTKKLSAGNFPHSAFLNNLNDTFCNAPANSEALKVQADLAGHQVVGNGCA
jgi:hypothetical protein